MCKEMDRAVILVILSLVLTGCVERTLYIKSTPPGAHVTLNHKPIGETPLEHTFYHYGTYSVRLEKEGYEIAEHEAEVKGPWYEHAPVDLVAEILPTRHHIERELHYTLEEKKVTPP